MLIVRMLLCAVALPTMSAVAAACEHCRAAQAAAAAQLAAESSPTDLAVAAIRTAGQELRQSQAALQNLCEESGKLQGTRDSMQRKLQVVNADLLALKTHVQTSDFPVVISERIVRCEDDAHTVAGELLIQQDVLQAAIAEMTAELAAGEQNRLQLVKQIHQRQTEILLAEHRSSRIRTLTLSAKSSQPLQAIRIIAPPVSAESQRKQRLNDFLKNGLGNSTLQQTAATP